MPAARSVVSRVVQAQPGQRSAALACGAGLGDVERRRDRHSRVRCVAALLQDPQAGLRGERLARGHHAARAKHWRAPGDEGGGHEPAGSAGPMPRAGQEAARSPAAVAARGAIQQRAWRRTAARSWAPSRQGWRGWPGWRQHPGQPDNKYSEDLGAAAALCCGQAIGSGSPRAVRAWCSAVPPRASLNRTMGQALP
jgi:hypothetical protein